MVVLLIYSYLIYPVEKESIFTLIPNITPYITYALLFIKSLNTTLKTQRVMRLSPFSEMACFKICLNFHVLNIFALIKIPTYKMLLIVNSAIYICNNIPYPTELQSSKLGRYKYRRLVNTIFDNC